jgi:hypothetical protein
LHNESNVSWLGTYSNVAPLFTVHFAPTETSRLIMAVRFFRDIITERSRRCVPHLIFAIK